MDNIPIRAADLHAKVLADKAAYRRHLARLPIAEKLQILEEMRDTTRALAKLRAENKAMIRATVSAREKNDRT